MSPRASMRTLWPKRWNTNCTDCDWKLLWMSAPAPGVMKIIPIWPTVRRLIAGLPKGACKRNHDVNHTTLLLTNAIVLTMDAALTQYEPGAVAVQGDHIAAVGPEAELRAQFPAVQIIDCGGKVLMPGLVNAHGHAAMTLLRGLADDLRLDVWLLGYMMPVEREFVSPEFVHLGTQLACAEMIRSGTTCFADMYYFEDSVAHATAEAGLRGVLGQSVLKFPAPDAASFEESLDAARVFVRAWKGHPLIVPSVAPHAPYTCTPEILRACADLAAEFDVPLQIHLAETAQEVSNSRKENDAPVIAYVEKHGVLDVKVVAAHCVHVDENEIAILRRHNVGVAHNPSSNLKLASGVAPVRDMLKAGISVGIGTDGAASNNDLDMFEEMRLAALVAKNANNDPTVLPAAQAVGMATRMGARALHMEQLIGSLEPGKRADLILVDAARAHNAPRFRREQEGVYAQLVYAAHAHDVTDVMVNGQWVMRDDQLTTLDEKTLLTRAEDYARRIDQFLIAREHSVLSKLIAIGGAGRGRASRCRRRPGWPIRPPCWRRCAGLTSKSCTNATTASTTLTSPGMTPTRASCAIARMNSWTPTAE